MKDTCKQTSQHRRAPRVELICTGRDQPKLRIRIFQQVWVSKQQLTVEMSVFSAEFVAMKHGIETL